jgi:hypothetical protein
VAPAPKAVDAAEQKARARAARISATRGLFQRAATSGGSDGSYGGGMRGGEGGGRRGGEGGSKRGSSSTSNNGTGQ